MTLAATAIAVGLATAAFAQDGGCQNGCGNNPPTPEPETPPTTVINNTNNNTATGGNAMATSTAENGDQIVTLNSKYKAAASAVNINAYGGGNGSPCYDFTGVGLSVLEASVSFADGSTNMKCVRETEALELVADLLDKSIVVWLNIGDKRVFLETADMLRDVIIIDDVPVWENALKRKDGLVESAFGDANETVRAAPAGVVGADAQGKIICPAGTRLVGVSCTKG